MVIRRIDQLYNIPQLPKNWKINNLDEYLITNPTYGLNAAAEPFSEMLPKYLRITDITDDGLYSTNNMVSVSVEGYEDYILENGDLVLARTGASVGKSYLYNTKDGTLVYAGYLIRVKTDPTKLIPEYLKYYVQSKFYWDWIAKVSMRSGQPGVNATQYGSLPVFCPSSNTEQYAIAEVLSDVDALIEAQEALIEKKRLIKQGVMQELLTGKRRLPGYKEDWHYTTLKDIGTTYSGLSGKSKSDFENGNSPYIPFLNILENPIIKIDQFDYVNIESSELQNKAVYGDLFFNGSSETPEEVGMCSVLLQKVSNLYLNSFCFGFRLFENGSYDPLFLSYLFRSQVGRELMYSLAQGATRYNLSKTKFLELDIKVPNYNEQQEIAEIIKDIDLELNILAEKVKKIKKIKQGMMQELLTGRTRLV